MGENARWYVIHTYSGHENKVASNIEKAVISRGFEDLIKEVRVPTETVTEIKNSKKITLEKKIFPSYVLLKMEITEKTWDLVRNTNGCTGFLGGPAEAFPLTEEEMQRFGISEKKKIEVFYSIGDNVSILYGPLESNVGIVESIDTDKNCVKVIVSMFGRETPVELKLDQVEKIS
ncbi:MAG: transcription termination/antitermination protein NusG [Candidatus Paraimprobicoccus trichonymphae]|uniref:Transcription termination/antitermination protein NusG n=1 Tax=Candidatus Paraimprobicoccus trichonymphae TaxID=3033793 RepID=A0AA48IBJ2_9FIRM|nr:MAG: transcription termination/antitermination protein NusG [Candidatus Paraimprobicoccus trichonymphae]